MSITRPARTLRGLGILLAPLLISGCALSPWNPGTATATLELEDGSGRSFAGGTCEREPTDDGLEYFVLNIGRPSAGESATIRVELELEGGATFAGDGSGDGVRVEHAGSAWGLARNPVALRFNDDVTEGSAQLTGVPTSEGFVDSRHGSLNFAC